MPRLKGSDELHRLIKSLTPAEKGYFKKFATRHLPAGSNALELFNIVNHQAVFDEAPLKKKFKDLAVMKVYLFDAILQSLSISAGAANDKIAALQNLISIELLVQRGFYDKALKAANTGLEKAVKQEDYWMEEGMLWQRWVLTKKTAPLERVFDEHLDYFKQLEYLRKKQVRYDQIYRANEFSYLWEKLHIFKQKDPFNIEEYADIKLLNDNSRDYGYKDKRMRLQALAMYHYLKLDWQKNYETTKEWYLMEKKLMQANSKPVNLRTYILANRNLFYTCILMHRCKEAAQLLAELKKAGTDPSMDQDEYRLALIVKQQYVYFQGGQHKAGEKYSAEVFSGMDFKPYLDKYGISVVEIYKSRILFEYSNSNYRAMFNTMGELYGLTLKKYAPAYLKNAEFLKIVVQIDTANFDMVPAMIKNLMRSKQVQLSPNEKVVLKILKETTPANLRQKMKQIVEIPVANGEVLWLFGALTFNRWAQSKIENKSIASLFAADNVE